MLFGEARVGNGSLGQPAGSNTMSVEEQIQHSILIVSEDKKILSFIKRSFQNASILSAEYTDNASEARRRILERYYTIVVINASLSGETGSDLAIYTARQCSASVLLIVPAGIYEETMELVTDLVYLYWTNRFRSRSSAAPCGFFLPFSPE